MTNEQSDRKASEVVDLLRETVIVINIEMSDFFYHRIRSKERWSVKLS